VLVNVNGHTVVETAMTEVTITIDRSGQLVTEASHIMTVTIEVERMVEVERAGCNSTRAMVPVKTGRFAVTVAPEPDQHTENST